MNKALVLASASPRRKDLLTQMGFKFNIIVSDVDESIGPGIQPFQAVEALALSKAMEVSAKLEEGLVIGADTIVVFENEVLGKPSNEQDAKRMLAALSGNKHQVLTGVAVVDVVSGQRIVTHEKTEVEFRLIDNQEIENYIKTGEPMDKAGSYAIQGRGALFVKKITGCYFNVVGLPIYKLGSMLKEFDVNAL